MRIVRNALFVVALILVLIVVGAFVFLRGTLPKIDGTVKLNGLDGQVEIVRDDEGVPHIFAATDHDVFFAMGYVHAQDRMWQIEFQRRIGAGRLSEVLGESTLSTDKFLRTLGFYRSAKTAFDALDSQTQADLQAYADGVNAWLDEKHPLPVEFLVLGFKPEPWSVYDSMVWAKMMAWNLGGNYGQELLHARLLQSVGEARTNELLPNYPSEGATILAAENLSAPLTDILLDIDNTLQNDFNLGGVDIGSNNWVVSGERTESGMPLLANDPHLGAQIPSVWYLAEVQGDKIHVTGPSFPGLPFFPIGHNDNIAWGVTNLGPDVQDLYMERINPKNLNQYEVNGEWVDMDIVEEPIYIKGQDEPILWAARSTRHGPLISDVSGNTQTAVAMQWTALAPNDTTAQAYVRLNYATNWDEFTAALESYIAPSQNFVYADIEGNIGYYGPGNIPIRSKGNGSVPVPGWTDDYQWTGMIPFAELPHAFNPEKGFIATANNKVITDDYPYFISNDWASPHRAQRITDLIAQKSSHGEKISVADMAAIQADQVSLQAKELLPLLLAVQPTDKRQTRALEYLQDWHGDSTVDSIATTIYQAWLMELGQVILQDDLSGDLYDDFVIRKHPTFLQNIVNDPDTVWCDNILTTPKETCIDAASMALDDALDLLETDFGKNMDKWEWGKIHRTQYPHNPFSEVPALRRFFHREIANGGDTYTIDVAPPSYKEDTLFSQYHVVSYRQVVDVSEFNNSIFIHTTGQSGNVFDSHYDDFIERHRNVEYIPMTFGRNNANGQTLILRPK